MKRWSRWLGACLVVLSVGCGGDPGDGSPVSVDEPIIGGGPDRGRDPAVLALLTDDGMLCSGTLVGRQWVLTARHCVSRVTDELDCDRPGRQVLGDRVPATIRVLSGDDVRSAREVARGRSLVVPRSDRLCDADIALLVLDRPVYSIAPAPLALRAAPATGQRVNLVGFGLRSERTLTLVGQRYRRDRVRVREVAPGEFEIGEGVCSGDSGGPALDPETGAVVGVLSRGSDTCRGAGTSNVFTRVDVWERLFIAAR